MSQTCQPGGVEPVEVILEWEGPAELNPAAFAGPKELDGYLA